MKKEKKLKDTDGFVVYVGKKNERTAFMVRHKNINNGKVVPLNMEDLLSYLVESNKKIKKKNKSEQKKELEFQKRIQWRNKHTNPEPLIKWLEDSEQLQEEK